ncbi:MAG: phosphatidylserine decarboxylase [Planctomycetota bacterium]|jgi:phosphatidylserine decarboxylase
MIRVPLTKYGLPQVAVLPAIQIAVMLAALLAWPKSFSLWGMLIIELILAAVLLWTLSFFRDPERTAPTDSNLLLAPADGRVTNIEFVDEDDFIGGAALRIGIFLSIFDVHINRAPCNVKVERLTYKKGRFKNAMTPHSGQVNESNDLWLIRTNDPPDKLIVRQVSGAIAKRIVCSAAEGQNLAGGEKFGMIKFGSRTELYIPARDNVKCLVSVGDKVKAGLSALVRYE